MGWVMNVRGAPKETGETKHALRQLDLSSCLRWRYIRRVSCAEVSFQLFWTHRVTHKLGLPDGWKLVGPLQGDKERGADEPNFSQCPETAGF